MRSRGRRPPWRSCPRVPANLLASNLGIPADLSLAVRIGLHGDRRSLDTGTVNGEHFAVMAGAGFDARMISDASRKMKARLGRAAYLWTGARNLMLHRASAVIEVDGERFFRGRVSAVLAGNVGKILGGLEVFRGAEPDSGLLELGVVTARNPADWARVFGRIVAGQPAEVEVRPHHQRKADQDPVRPAVPLRAGRRRTESDSQAEDQGPPRVDHGVRSALRARAAAARAWLIRPRSGSALPPVLPSV